jgi:hypothetical protein
MRVAYILAGAVLVIVLYVGVRAMRIEGMSQEERKEGCKRCHPPRGYGCLGALLETASGQPYYECHVAHNCPPDRRCS